MQHAPLWPAFVHFDGIEELTWIANDADWQQFREEVFSTATEDRLVDCRGLCFPLSPGNLQTPVPGKHTDEVSLEEINELIRQHILAYLEKHNYDTSSIK